MLNQDPRDIVMRLASKVGKKEARRLCVAEGISTSTFDKIYGDRYTREVGTLVRDAIARAWDRRNNKAS